MAISGDNIDTTKAYEHIEIKAKFLPSLLAIAIGIVLSGCGGGGSSAKTNPNISVPPVVNPDDNDSDHGIDNGSGNDNGVGNGSNNGSENGNDNGSEPIQDKYNPADYDVVVPHTSANKVKVGVMDTGVEINDALKHAVQSVSLYIEDYQNGTLTQEDLTNAGIDVQDIDPDKHGTVVAQIIAAKYANGSDATDGLAKEVAQIYGMATSATGNGLGTTSANYLAALELNNTHGVKLFNGSFGEFYDDNPSYKATLTQYALKLADAGSLVVMATGNNGFEQPTTESLLPTLDAAIEKGWLAVTGVDQTGSELYRDEDGKGANACGQAAAWCLAGDYVTGPLVSPSNGGLVMFMGTSGATPQVTSTAALVWSAFPWMTHDQVRQTILSNADFIDDAKGLTDENGLGTLYNDTFGWGKLDIAGSMKGPQSFLSRFGENFDANVNSDLAVFANNIHGDAGLIKSGLGTLALTGDSTYLGSTVVNAGKLQVTGSIQSGVEVNPSAVLSGKGTVGTVLNNGMVSTLDGRLTVNGDYAQAYDATLQYQLNNHLSVNGEAVLDGILDISAKDHALVTQGEHLVLDATNVVGNFTTTKSSSAFLTVQDAVVDGKQVKVEVDFADAASAGTVLGGISDASGLLTNRLMDRASEQALNGENTTLTRYVAGIQQARTQAQAQAVLNSNAGALFAETPSVLLRNDSLVSAQIAQRTHQVTKQSQSGVWSSAGYLESANEAKGWDKVDSEIYSITVGADAKVGDDAVVGGFITDYNEQSKFDASNGSSETEMLTFSLYGKWTNPDLYYVTATAQYGVGETAFKRQVTNINVTENSTTQTDLDKFGFYAELGQEFTKGLFRLTPYIGLSHNQVSMDSLKETSNFGMTVGDLTAKETKAHVGFRSDYQLSSHLDMSGYLEYAYALDRSLPTVYLASNIASDLVVAYQAPSFEKDFLMYGLSFNYQTAHQNLNMFGDVAANVFNQNEYQIQVGLKYAF